MAGNITDYTSPVDTIRPSDRGIDAATMAARQVNRIYTEEAASTQNAYGQLARGVQGDIKDVGAVATQYVDYQDKSKVSAAATSGLANIEQAFQRTMKGYTDPDGTVHPAADPNDPTVLQKFTDENITPFLENLKQIPFGENGKNYALAKADELQQHLSTQFRGEAANLAARGAVLRDDATTNSLGALVTATPTFGNMDFAIKQQTESIDIAKGGAAITAEGAQTLEGAKLTKIKTLVHAGALAAIQKSSNPEATAAAWGQKYGQYVTPGELIQLGKAAHTQMRMDAAFTKQAQVAQKQLETMQADRFVASSVASVIRPDGSIDATMKPQLMKDLHTAVFGNPDTGQKALPGMSSADAIKLFNFATSDEIVKGSDPTVKGQLQDKLYANELTPMDIIKATNDGNLSHADAGVLMGQYKDVTEHPLNDKGFEAAMKGVDSALVVPTNIADFKQEFFTKYRQLDPKDRPGALVFSDPNSLISKMIAAHQPSNGDKMQYKVMQSLGQGITDPAKAAALINAPQLPPGMKVEDAVKQYGPGALVKNSRGDIVTLPK